ncbi:MAG: hypothetical protein HY279_00095 [Nitrospinae bacterium]|nr:hypothetical protein [Nitrospinota bacterium]
MEKNSLKLFLKRFIFSISPISPFLLNLFLLFFTFPYYSSVLAGDDDIQKIHKLKQENSRLELELKAAVKPSIYAALDIEAKKIYLKIKGVVVKEFNIAGIETIGSGYFNGYYSMVKRKAVFPPRRIEIKPQQNKERGNAAGSANEPAQQPDTFDIEDMPSDYTLIFNEGLSISVSPRFKGGFFMSVLNQTIRGLRYIWNSSCRIWNYFKDTPFIKIQIVMDRDDARALYWSLPDNADFIVIDSK